MESVHAIQSVLLVEDDVDTREWLITLLAKAEGLRLAYACGSVAEALAWLKDSMPPDIVLTDLGLPDGSGIDVIKAASLLPGCEVLVLTIFGDEKNVLSAIDAGAGGYLLKDGSLDFISEHLNCLRSGGSPLSPRIARTLIRRARVSPEANDPPSGTQPHPLSEREYEVLVGISKGFAYKEVAAALNISTNTVRTHVRKIYSKLSVNSNLEALFEYNRLMHEHGLPRLG